LFFVIFARIHFTMLQIIQKTIKNILLFAVLISFVLSTSGFIVTRHICSHDSSEIVFGEISDGCCELEKIETEYSCCSPEKVADKNNEGDCCQFDKNYVRLSENFISSEKSDFGKKIQLCCLTAITKVISTQDEVSFPDKVNHTFSQEKIPKTKKYLLYHQVKVEPPLL